MNSLHLISTNFCVCEQSMKDTRVIMLSLEHAASGTNLTEASHIILIDPVAGSESEAFSIERQAIGRAHRMGQNKQVSKTSVK